MGGRSKSAMYNMRGMRRKLTWRSWCLAAAVLAAAALFPLARVYDTFPGDERALVEFQGLQTGWLDAAALALSRLGERPTAAVPVVGAILLLLVVRHWADAAMVALSAVPMLLGEALKWLVARPRPDYLLLGPEPTGLSFPSGHSVYACLLVGILIYLSGKLVPSPGIRRSLQAALAGVILAMGASRVYLGVHWPSDVIGGYLFGGLALLGLVGLRNLLADRWRPR